MARCDECGEDREDTEDVIDPFTYEIDDREVYMMLCKDCYQQRSDNI